MTWWGKVVGGTFGLLIGGPIGATLGAVIGHQLDANFDKSAGFQNYFPGDQERTQAAFFTATFSVMGHIAKADGRVSSSEISLAQQLMGSMRLNKAQRKTAIMLFNQGKKAEFDLHAVLEQFRRECNRRSTLIQMFLEIQVQAALADGKLDSRTNDVLVAIGQALGFQQADLKAIIEMMRGTGRGQVASTNSVADPYKVLGVRPDMPLEEIKKSYRRLLSQYHPDKLVSKGLPEEMVKLANEKTHQIRTAWKQIQTSHSAP